MWFLALLQCTCYIVWGAAWGLLSWSLQAVWVVTHYSWALTAPIAWLTHDIAGWQTVNTHLVVLPDTPPRWFTFT